MREEKNAISSMLQWVAMFITIAFPIAQYVFRSNFKFLFGEHTDFFSISTIIALIVSFTIIIILYAYRYVLGLKIYLSRKQKNKYFESLRNRNLDNEEYSEEILEPFYFTIYNIAIASLFFMIISFAIFISSSNISWVLCVSYVVLISTMVFPMATFAIKLYAENSYHTRNQLASDMIIEKIRAYFVGEMKIESSKVDEIGFSRSIKTLIVEHNQQKYIVRSDINDPEKFFDIKKYNQ